MRASSGMNHSISSVSCSAPKHASRIKEAAALLNRLITQDTEPEPGPNGPKKAPQKKPKGNADTSPEDAKARNDSTPKAATTADSDEVASDPTCEQPSPTADTEEPRPEGCSDGTLPPGSHLLSDMVRIRDGVAEDRTISAHDIDMRHGRKSASKRFDGHKTSVCVDTSSKLILSLDVLTGNAADNTGALDLVHQAAKNTGIPVRKAIGDCAFGDAATRQAFDDAGIDLSAKVPSPPANEPFHRSRFVLDLTSKIATCPVGHTTSETNYAYHRNGTTEQFQFPLSVCQSCPHKEECLLAADKKRRRGRTLTLHPQEHLLERARQHQKSSAFREDIKARQIVEHRQARMIQLGGRQARYFGRIKSKYQAYMIAIVANLTQMAGSSLSSWGQWARWCFDSFSRTANIPVRPSSST